ncbi:putative flavonol 3-O-glucosyltransferase [Helianthus anomalus]
MATTTIELIFIPLPVIGHMKSTIEIAKLLTNRDQRLSITVLIMQPPSGLRTSSAIATYIESLADKSTQHMRYITLPQPETLPARDPKAPMTFVNEYIHTHCKHVTNVVTEIISQPGSGKLSGFVIDMLCPGMIDVANAFNVPTYVFFTSSAAYLGFELYIQTLCDDQNQDVVGLTNSDGVVEVPGFVNPVPTKVFPSGYDTKEGVDCVLLISRKLRGVKAIIVNSFLEFETHAIESLTSDKRVPMVYPVGPVLNPVGGDNENSDSDVIKWLDSQPRSSVVFLCFGSLGCFDEVQVKEIAYALERSGHHFLWSLRQPPSPEQASRHSGDYEDQGVVLPEGFLERIGESGKGKVIGWAPQMAVLAHSAVGGFVTHCGWNSVLESMWFGVPMAAWPIYAEQQMNAFEMVVELGLGVEIKLDYKKDLYNPKNDIVTTEEIESGIRRLMDNDEMREKMKEMGKMSRLTVREGGSSYASVGLLIQDFIGNA